MYFAPHHQTKKIGEKTGKYIFDVRIPNPSRKKGKSGGFRLIMFYHYANKTAEIGKIFKRSDLDWKGEGGKKQNEFDEYIEIVKNKLNKR